MRKHRHLWSRTLVGAAFVAALIGLAPEKMQSEHQERPITEAEVPKPALATLKRLASGSVITAFAEEIENDHKMYEGSWIGPNGNIDATVTELGDLLEIEQTLPGSKVPDAVRNAGKKVVGDPATITFEKKTVVLYELHFQKEGKNQEVILTPDAREFDEPNGDGSE